MARTLPDIDASFGVAAFRDVHEHPELSGHEERTAWLVATTLRKAGFTVTEGIGGYGVRGTLRNGEGRHVAIRTEMDALPVEEDTGLAYASTARGVWRGRSAPVMHACGHDVHLAALLTAAKYLAENTKKWNGQLDVIAQPAEETLCGAQAMVDDGLWHDGTPEVIFAQHTAPIPAGYVAHGTPYVFAAHLGLTVRIFGAGGHRNAPHLANDPLVTAAHTIIRLQSIISQETGPAEPITVAVGGLDDGGVVNVVPPSVTFEVWIRAMTPDALARIETSVRRIIEAESQAGGCDRAPEVTVTSRSGAVVSDVAETTRVKAVHAAMFGPNNVIDWVPAMAADDVTNLATDDTRLCYWILGIVPIEEWNARTGAAADRMMASPQNHSAQFNPDTDSVLVGARALIAAVMNS